MPGVKKVDHCKLGGFSLIEFMVAMVLGAVLVSGVVAIYLASKQSYTESQQVAELSENAQFAMRLLSEVLLHTGFFGNSDSHAALLEPAPVGDCSSAGANAYAMLPYLLAQEATTNSLSAGQSATPVFGCVGGALANSDVLLVKHVLPRPLYDADPLVAGAARDGVPSFPEAAVSGEVYAISSPSSVRLMHGADVVAGTVMSAWRDAPAINAAAWPYRTSVFHVRPSNGQPTLSWHRLVWDSTAGQMAMVTEDLVPGVEMMRFRFGVDENNDGQLDVWLSTAAMRTRAALTSIRAWESVMAVEVFLLMRTVSRDADYRDSKTYNVAGTLISPADGEDRWRRLLVSQRFFLRNPAYAERRGR